ncbi:hypothetical protein GEMRC1_010539 [Eukaryota sp. GEM-RC1]
MTSRPTLMIPSTHALDGGLVPKSPRAVLGIKREQEIVAKHEGLYEQNQERSLNTPRRKFQREQEIVQSETQRFQQRQQFLAHKQEMLSKAQSLISNKSDENVVKEVYSPKPKSSPVVATSPGPVPFSSSLKTTRQVEHDDESRAYLSKSVHEYNRSVAVQKSPGRRS